MPDSIAEGVDDFLAVSTGSLVYGATYFPQKIFVFLVLLLKIKGLVLRPDPLCLIRPRRKLSHNPFPSQSR